MTRNRNSLSNNLDAFYDKIVSPRVIGIINKINYSYYGKVFNQAIFKWSRVTHTKPCASRWIRDPL
jgi:hypothetical protein